MAELVLLDGVPYFAEVKQASQKSREGGVGVLELTFTEPVIGNDVNDVFTRVEVLSENVRIQYIDASIIEVSSSFPSGECITETIKLMATKRNNVRR